MEMFLLVLFLILTMTKLKRLLYLLISLEMLLCILFLKGKKIFMKFILIVFFLVMMASEGAVGLSLLVGLNRKKKYKNVGNFSSTFF